MLLIRGHGTYLRTAIGIISSAMPEWDSDTTLRLDRSCPRSFCTTNMLVARCHEVIGRGVARRTSGQEPKVRRASPSVSSILSSLVLQLPGSPVGDIKDTGATVYGS